MINPVKKLRMATGLSVMALVTLHGCSYETWYKVEAGYSTRVPKSVVAALKNAGVQFDEIQLQQDYKAWQLAKAKAEVAQKKNAAC